MLYIHWNPDPILIDLGFIALRWYSLLFAFGIFLCFLYFKKTFQAENLPLEKLDKLTIYVIVGIVLGARLGHCLFYEFDYYKDHLLEMILPFRFEPEFEFTGFRGLASHGGAIGILTALILFSRRHKIGLKFLLDEISVVIPLAGASIRFGNLMNSEIIGSPTDLPWAFVFERVDMVPRHPGQLYEALSYLLIFGILWFVKRKNLKVAPGFRFGLFLVLLFLARFLIEFTKANQVDFEAGMSLNMGQWLSIPFILAGAGIMYYFGKAQKQ